MGALFCCPVDAIIMAASIHCQEPFKKPTMKIMKEHDKFVKSQARSYDARRRFDQGMNILLYIFML
jgi:hypothetical protein